MAGSSLNVVTVGCKLPHGVLAQVDDVSVTFNGANSTLIIGGHGITEQVDAEFWQAWLAQSKDLAFVREGLVFADGKADNTKAQAKEKLGTKTGLEPVNPAESKEVKPLKVD